MLKRDIALKINLVVLFLAGLMDMRRGIAHTFQVRYSVVNLAGIEPIPDSLVLMGAFGISNFLTGLIYFLIIWKAKPIAPYVLLLIPVSYFLGGMGLAYQNVTGDGEFVGRYMMAIYLSICLLASVLYFVSRKTTSAQLSAKQ